MPDRSQAGTLRSIIGYSLMIGVAIALFFIVLSAGSKLDASAPTISAAAPGAMPAAVCEIIHPPPMLGG